jgi:hypothetical protein
MPFTWASPEAQNAKNPIVIPVAKPRVEVWPPLSWLAGTEMRSSARRLRDAKTLRMTPPLNTQLPLPLVGQNSVEDVSLVVK